MTHVLDAAGRIKESWGSVALADLGDYAQGRIIRGGAVDWEAYDASTLGAVLIGTGANVIADTTPTFVGVVSFSAGIILGELNADPANPAEGYAVMWMGDGTGTGDDGDILMKITAGGVTKTVTLVDFSSL